MAPNRTPDCHLEPLWYLAQYKRMEAFNEANEAKKKSFKCWPIFQITPDQDDQRLHWIVVVITHETFPFAKATCQIRIGETWFDATRVSNPTAVIRVDGEEHRNFATIRVKVPRILNDERLHFTPLEMARDPKDGALKPVFSADKMIWANLRLEIKSSSQIDVMIKRKALPEACCEFQDPKHYRDVYRWGTEEEFEFEAAAIRNFNRKSVYPCWLLLCHPSNDELPVPGSKGIMRQQCLVIMAIPNLPEDFPRVGELCDLAFALEIPALEKDAETTKDNKRLKRRGLKYLGGTRLDNPYEKFRLDRSSEYGSSWDNYSTFKVSVYKESSRDYSPLDEFACKLDWSMVSENSQKPRVTLDSGSAFQAHVWLDISTTTKNVELNALERAIGQSVNSRVAQAFSYIRTFDPAKNFNLFEAFPHMHIDDQLPDNLRASFECLDKDQKHVYRTVLADLPARVGIIPGGPGTGKTDLMLAICALALSTHGKTQIRGGPILLILEANRPANAAATRVVQYLEELGRTDLRIVRAYNLNYEGLWGTRRYFKADSNDEVSSGFHFDECFQTHRPEYVPQLRIGRKDECLALNLKEAVQQYLKRHIEDFSLMSELLNADADEIKSHRDLSDETVLVEWNALFSRVLNETDIVITTTVGAAKIAEHFRPQLVIYDDAARARELSTLVAIANFPSAEAWLFTGTVEMTRPYVSSWGVPNFWNPWAVQLRTSLMERYLSVTPNALRLSLNHQAHGDLHILSSDLFWGGKIQSALPSSERSPPSTMHLLEYCRSLAVRQTLTVPRLLVHVKRSAEDKEENSKLNNNHLYWVIQHVVRHLVQDPEFRTTDGTERGSIIIATPYRAQFSRYRKAINGLMNQLDREHRLAGGHGKMLHRDVLVEARTADTVQGHSADCIIFDMVSSRATPHVADPNRMCVALTRAKQMEIIVMEWGMSGPRPPSFGRRLGISGIHIDLLYEHCRSRDQVITVDPDSDIQQAKEEYSLHRDATGTGQDLSAVPRQLPALPSSLDLPQDDERAGPSPATATSNTPAAEWNEDDGDVEDMFGREGKFGFDMVRKAIKLGLNLSADGDQSR